MLLFLKNELDKEKGFVVNEVLLDNQIIRLLVWNDKTNELVCSIESYNRIDYIIRTYDFDNLTVNQTTKLINTTSEELEAELSKILPLFKREGNLPKT